MVKHVLRHWLASKWDELLTEEYEKGWLDGYRARADRCHPQKDD